MTPAGTSNELDVQNGWEENTHTHTTMAFLNPGVNEDIDFESASKCKLGHVLSDIVWRILFLRRTLGPHTHIMLSKMYAKDAFRQVALWNGTVARSSGMSSGILWW